MPESPAAVPAESTDVVAATPSSAHLRTIAFTLVSVATVILLLQLIQPVLIPFVLSALLFYALDPAVDWLQKRHVPRAIGAALLLVVAVSGCGPDVLAARTGADGDRPTPRRRTEVGDSRACSTPFPTTDPCW